MGKGNKVVNIKTWRLKKRFSFIFKTLDYLKGLFVKRDNLEKQHVSLKKSANH